MQSLNDFSFSGGDAFVQSLEQLYGGQTGVFGARARDTFNALGRIRELHTKDYSPANGADYGGDRFARELRLAKRSRLPDSPCFRTGGNGEFRRDDPAPCNHKTTRPRD